MSALTLNKIRFHGGVWEGVIDSADTPGSQPGVTVRLLDRKIDGVTLRAAETAGSWHLSIPVPAEALGDGVQCFVIYDEATGTKLGDFTVISGEPLADDLRAEIALLRAELDMLKRAFRRHCLETA
ncbi:hypothetical protein [Tritonibacter horizontis]|uniref:Uncharacterized protein n=1 Tax=Tritonibacter horizontis TaxID=1768241 RepID=A0A132BZ05_9RHOB|nr:hypothetical protein [Tritonibacter horizontis]KUP92990.1 hypothetical protein TRIHO_21130 [Tritonibacter horizontis]